MFDIISRGAVVVLSTLSVAGAIKLAAGPLQASGPATMLRPLSAGVRTADNRIAPVVALRDPFAEPRPHTLAIAAPGAAPSPAARAVGERLDVLPSNLTHDTIPALPGTPADATAGEPRVTAVVTGPHPYAMLDTGGVHEIKGLGERVGGVVIVAIDIDGVRLSDGRRLLVDPAVRS